MLSDRLSAAINRFDQEFSIAEYNSFNCDTRDEMNDVEIDLASAIAEINSFSEETWLRIRQPIDMKVGGKLLAFGLRMATAAIRTMDCRFVKAGIFALILDRDTVDCRDIYVNLAVLHDAATRIACDIDSILNAAAANATQKRREIIQDGFQAGPDYMKSIQSMGVELLETKQGPLYKMNLF